MTDRISFPPLLDLSHDELRFERERLLSRITQSSALTRRFGRRRLIAGGLAVAFAAAAAIALPLTLGNGDARHLLVPGAKLVKNSVTVTTLEEANAHLPFKAVLPSDATPTGGIQVPIAGKPSDASGWLTAEFDSGGGGVLLSEYSSDATVETLRQWAAEPCEGCTTRQVVIEDGVHVLVLESSVFGLRLQWLRGDGASPVMTELDWRTDMPTPHNVVPSQDVALAIAGDMIRRGG